MNAQNFTCMVPIMINNNNVWCLTAEVTFNLIYVHNSKVQKRVICFIFNYRHYKLVVEGLNITFIQVILMVNLKTFHWHLKDGTIGSLGEISSQSRNIRRQVKII
jgi:hypothetical protein